MDTNESEEHEKQLQLLAEYNFQLAQAKADLDITHLKNQKVKQDGDEITKKLEDTEKEVERLQHAVEEMTHVSFPNDDLNLSCNNEEITLDDNLVSPAGGTSSKDEKLRVSLQSNNETVEERDAIITPQSNESNNSRFGVQDNITTNTNDPSASMIQEHTSNDDEDTDDDDPFSTYDEETRSYSQKAKSAPLTPERSLHRLFQR